MDAISGYWVERVRDGIEQNDLSWKLVNCDGKERKRMNKFNVRVSQGAFGINLVFVYYILCMYVEGKCPSNRNSAYQQDIYELNC